MKTSLGSIALHIELTQTVTARWYDKVDTVNLELFGGKKIMHL